MVNTTNYSIHFDSKVKCVKLPNFASRALAWRASIQKVQLISNAQNVEIVNNNFCCFSQSNAKILLGIIFPPSILLFNFKSSEIDRRYCDFKLANSNRYLNENVERQKYHNSMNNNYQVSSNSS